MITKYERYCIICGRPADAIHHCIEGTANRKKSEKFDLKMPLCNECHNMTDNSVHFNSKMNSMSHIIGQLWYERNYILEKRELPFEGLGEEARESFRREFGKSYL